MDNIIACQTCGLVQTVGSVPKHSVAHCARCACQSGHRRHNSRLRTLVFSLAALILYFRSNIYPLVTTEYHGLHSETTTLEGIRSLFRLGEYAISSLVFCTSILTPALK